jgi:hypothetical protein
MKKKNNKYKKIYPNAVRLRIWKRSTGLEASHSRVKRNHGRGHVAGSVRRKRGRSWR